MRTLSDFEFSQVLAALKTTVKELEGQHALSRLESKLDEYHVAVEDHDRAWATSRMLKRCYDIAPDGCSFENCYLTVGGQILVGPEYAVSEPFASSFAGKVIFIEVESPGQIGVSTCDNMEELASKSLDYRKYIIPLYYFKRTGENVEIVDLRTMPHSDAFVTVATAAKE